MIRRVGCAGFLILTGMAAAPLVSAERAPRLIAGVDGQVLLDDKPFRGVGVNYFDCFLRTLRDGGDTSYEAGFALLAQKRVPFVRFCATGFWPVEMRLYQTDRAEYFRRLDGLIRTAEKQGIGVIPSLFWQHACVPDLVGEPVGEWANPRSKTRAWMRDYVREVVTRYRESPAIWAWEFGNEYSLQASLPNAKDHRPPVHPKLGTAASRSERDELSFAMVRQMFAAFATEVRLHDPRRLIFTGDSLPRPSAWHQEHENSWKEDSSEQFQEILGLANPDPVSGIEVHVYEPNTQRLRDAVTVSQRLGKPLLVGEFGVAGDAPAEREKLRRTLELIEELPVPLAALWVFDFPQQAEFNVDGQNQRAWQLDLISAANDRLSERVSWRLPESHEVLACVRHGAEWLENQVRSGTLEGHGAQTPVSVVAWKDPTLNPQHADGGLAHRGFLAGPQPGVPFSGATGEATAAAILAETVCPVSGGGWGRR